MWTLIWQLSQLLFLGMIVYIGILVIKALKIFELIRRGAPTGCIPIARKTLERRFGGRDVL